METNFLTQLPSMVSRLSSHDIFQFLEPLLNELKERSENQHYAEKDRNEAYSTLVLLIKRTNQSLDASHYTPNRGNQFCTGLLFQKLPDLEQDQSQIMEDLMRKFWISCHCSKRCPTKVLFNSALKLYKEYFGMHPDKKSQRVGGILQNNFPTSDDPRNTGQRNQCFKKADSKTNSGQDFSGKRKETIMCRRRGKITHFVF